MKTVLLVLATLLGGAVVAGAQPRADLTRRQRAIDNALVFAPDGPMLRAASLDQHEVVSDLLWVRAVLVFGDRWNQDPDPTWVTWLRGTVVAVTELDPGWRTPYYHGGTLLRVLGDIDGSDAVFKAGAAALPDDYFFPFSVGMNLYLYRDDPEGAVEWIDRASRLPNGPRQYAGLAAQLRSKGGDLEGAIAYLRERRRAAGSDPERADIDDQLGRLYHDRLVEGWAPQCQAYRQANGGPPASPAAFFAWLSQPVPDNPRGDAWVVGNDGCVRSEGAEPARLRRLRSAELQTMRDPATPAQP